MSVKHGLEDDGDLIERLRRWIFYAEEDLRFGARSCVAPHPLQCRARLT